MNEYNELTRIYKRRKKRGLRNPIFEKNRISKIPNLTDPLYSYPDKFRSKPSRF